ncbi:MAG TPA: GlsB/YeaQ/YmgE family stress response membrane protein [Stellaceae bacterium]
MYLSTESIVIIVVVGAIAGWLAGLVVQGTGFGLIGDIIIGIIGAFVGDWLLPRLHINLGVGLVAAIISAAIGAIVLLIILRLIRGGMRRA